MNTLPQGSPSPAVQLVDELLGEAQALGASDLHLIPDEDGSIVRVRVAGALSELRRIDGPVSQKLVGRFKVLADLLVYRTDIPQEGRIPLEDSCIGSEVRVATYPMRHGEKVALRFDTQAGETLLLDDLGLPELVTAELRTAISQPDGVVLLTGPSGSGKTTTLYACLRQLVQQTHLRNIVSVEDPIEHKLAGVMQTEINPHVGLDYETALRSILRQDPEVILIGEVRDRETAGIALEAGLTGHLVCSTIHAGTAPRVFARLMEMGIEPFAMTTTIRGVLAQRLLRRSCSVQIQHHGNCVQCRGTGYEGRVLLAEWVPMSRPLRAAVLERGDGETLTEAARLAGYVSLETQAAALLRAGVTDEEEVVRVLGHDWHENIDESYLSGGAGGPAPQSGGDVPLRSAAAEGAQAVIPRPESEAPAAGSGADGPGCGAGGEPGGGVRQAEGPAAGALPGAD